ncbi:MAG: hypothetical protein ABI400_04665 [Lacisediminihabitans sp.]
MEFASWLAGESWSDHPACTHPALASLARLVNDCSTNPGRARLVELIPSVIGLTDDDPLIGVLVTARASSAAIAVVSEARQRALAVGLFCLQRYVNGYAGAVAEQIEQFIVDGLASAPAAVLWAQEFSLGQLQPGPRELVRACTAALRVSVIGIAEACIKDPDATLHQLLSDTITDVTAIKPTPAQTSSAQNTPTQPQSGAQLRERMLLTHS